MIQVSVNMAQSGLYDRSQCYMMELGSSGRGLCYMIQVVGVFWIVDDSTTIVVSVLRDKGQCYLYGRSVLDVSYTTVVLVIRWAQCYMLWVSVT